MSSFRKVGSELYNMAQERLIACILADGSSITSVMERVREDFFLTPQYQVIFSAIAKIARKGENVSQVLVAQTLEESGFLGQAGGVETIAKLADDGEDFLLDAPIEQYCQILREYAIKHSLREDVSVILSDFVPDSGVSSIEAIGKMRSVIDERQFDMTQNSFVSTMEDLANDYQDRIDERHKQAIENSTNPGILGVPTSLPRLNEITSGWLAGQFITFAARTGIGKSIFSINQAVAAAQAGQSVLIMSLEMSKQEIEDRIVASVTGISLNQLKKGAIYDKKSVLQEGLSELANMKIVIDTTPYITMDMIRARAMRQSQSEDGLDLLIVDYIQLIKVPSPSVSRERDVADISRELKVLAKTLEIPLITAAQAQRPKDKEHASNAPGIHEIRESNAIAQDSDIVIMLHRKPSEDAGEAMTEVIVAKHRNGASGGRILCHSNLACSLLREAAEDQDLSDLDESLEDVDPWGDLDTLDPDFNSISEFDVPDDIDSKEVDSGDAF